MKINVQADLSATRGERESMKYKDLSLREINLLTRALSDSLNYKPKDRFDEKWELLLKLKKEAVWREEYAEQ